MMFMKKAVCLTAAAVLLFSAVFSSCREIDITETQAPTKTDVEPGTTGSEGTEATPADPKEEPVKDEDDLIRSGEYNHRNYGAFEMRSETVFPDTFSRATGAEGDSFDGHIYHIAALDLDLEIPDGYYIYRVPGMFRGPSYAHDSVRMEFVDEYVLTMQEVTEEQLTSDVWDQLDAFNGYRYSNTFMGPEYVIFSFKVFHKDYLPVESLYYSALLTNGELRMSGDYIVEVGCGLNQYSKAYKVINREDYTGDTYVFPGGQTGKVIYEDEFPLQKWTDALLNATNGTGIAYHYNDPQLNGIGEDSYYGYRFLEDSKSTYKKQTAMKFNQIFAKRVWDPQKSIMSDAWWADYQTALKMLEDPELAAYPEKPELRLPDEGTTPYDDYDREMRSGWTLSDEADTLRAFFYAAVKADNASVRLQDIVIIRKTSSTGFSLYGFYLRNAESGSYEFVEAGPDFVTGIDLSVSRSYMEQIR